MNRRRVHVVIALAAHAAAASVALAQAVGTAFTYQGELNSGSGPVDGTADFQFSLWDAASGGTQLGVTHAINNLTITDGLFVVELNGAGEFGASAFNGNARWLEIAVRSPAGSGAFATLIPRQELTPTPLALALPGLRTEQTDDGTRVPTSPNVIGGSPNNTVTGGVVGATIAGGGASGEVNSVTDDYGAVGGGTANRAGDNSGATNIRTHATVAGGHQNTAQGQYSTVGGGDGNFASGLRSTIAGGFNCNANGQYSTVPGGQSNQAGGYYSFAAGRMAKVRTAGDIGGGDIDGDQGTFIWADSTNEVFPSTGPDQFLVRAAGGMGIGTNSPQAGTMLDVAGTIRSSTGGFKLPDGTVIDSAADLGSSQWQQNGSNVYYGENDPGRVGVGTGSPGAKLHVVRSAVSTAPLTFRLTTQDFLFAPVYQLDFDENTLNATVDGTAASLDLNNISSGNVFLTRGGGKVGIGTSSPDRKLTVGDVSISNSEGLMRMESRSGTGTSNRAWDVGVPETDEVTTGNGYSFVIDDTQLGTGPEFMVKWGSGNVGIGTTSPGTSFTVAGANNQGASSAAIELTNTTSGTGRRYLLGSAGSGVFQVGDLSAGGATRLVVDPAGNVGIGTISPQSKLDVAGTVRTQVLEITGADVAERFPVSDKVEPGMVVEIDPDNPGKLKLARGAYNRRVAGVVSGAGDLPAGAILGNLPGHEDAPPIALTGRVWVHCDATDGAIEPGDLLTTSDTPGHAMRVTDYPRAQGAIIGKAMSRLDARATGLVLVLVNLQ